MGVTAASRPSIPSQLQDVRSLHELRRPITVDLFEKMVRAGVFGTDDDVFLWDGELVEAMTKGRPHTIAQTRIVFLLAGVVGDAHHVEQEPSVAVGEVRMPEPDVCVIRGRLEDYPERAPRAGDVALIVEVADSSLAIDRGEKLAAYAAERIPVYWVINLPDRQVEVYGDPTGPDDAPTYRGRQVHRSGDEFGIILDGREVGRVAVDDILP